MADLKLKDFGQKIGGARKDMYALGNIDLLNNAELAKVTRDKVWKRPNIQKELENGTDRVLLYWREQIRKGIPAKPVFSYKYDENAIAKAFITVTNRFKEFAETSQTIDQDKLNELICEYITTQGHYVHPIGVEGQSIYSASLYNFSRLTIDKIERLVEKEQFGMTQQQKDEDVLNKGIVVLHFGGEGADRCYFDGDKSNENCKALGIPCIGGTIFLYERTCQFYNEKFKDDTYILLYRGNGYKVLSINIEDREKALKTKEEMISFMLKKAKEIKVDKRKNGKQAFPRQLKHVKQENGATLPHHIRGGNYIETFGFKGGEYGNWMSEKDRQTSLDMGYVAFKNLATVLGISNKGISLGQELNIAFGARGHSAAKAHYEPLRNVINLTKMKGAGALAHEWGHALDAYLGKFSGGTSLYSELPGYKRTRKFSEMDELISMMQAKEADVEIDYSKQLENKKRALINQLKSWTGRIASEKVDPYIEKLLAPDSKLTIDDFSAFRKEHVGRCVPKNDRQMLEWSLKFFREAQKDIAENGEKRIEKRKVETEFKKGSKYFDEHCTKDGNYWSSEVEMFARAFDCYIEDKLKEKGIVDTYLSSGASGFALKGDNDEIHRAYPYGEERKRLNKAFDKLFESIREEL